MTNIININGVRISGGKHIVVRGGCVIIDGNEVELGEAKVINIQVQGDIQQVSADVCESLVVNGNAGRVTTVSGDVRCGNVEESVKTVSGDVYCQVVAGKVKTVSGDISKL